MKVAAVSLGRLNPPTRGHQIIVDKLSEQDAEPLLYLSRSHDSKKNPLSYEKKVYWCRKAFDDKVNVVESEARNMYEALTELWKAGYTDIIYVCGSDRAAEAERMNNYNGKPDKNGNIIYDFNSISVVKAGNDRINEDDIPIEMVSASMQRKFAAENDLDSFISGCPERLTEEECEELFNDVREGMGITEELNEDIVLGDTINYDNIDKFIKWCNNLSWVTKRQFMNKLKTSEPGKFSIIFSDNDRMEFTPERPGNLGGRISIYGTPDFSIRSNKIGLGKSSVGTITSIKNIIGLNSKPFFNIVFDENREHPIVKLINLPFINGIGHSASKLTRDNIVGSIQGNNTSSAPTVNSGQQVKELWDKYMLDPKELENVLNKIVDDTLAKQKVTYSKNVKNRLNLGDPALDYKNKLKTNIDLAIKFTNSSDYDKLKKELDTNARLLLKVKDELLADNNNDIGHYAEDVINTGSLDPIRTHSETLADLQRGNILVDVKLNYSGKSSSGKGINIEKLVHNIIEHPEQLMFIYKVDITGNDINSNLFSVYTEEFLNKTGIDDSWNKIGGMGTLTSVNVNSNKINKEKALDAFTSVKYRDITKFD